jgi:hopanoid biosynthesis associated RND transporter like protein HpnN
LSAASDRPFAARLWRIWDALILGRPWWLLAAAALFTAACFKYTLDHLRIDTNSTALISPDLAFQQDRVRFERAFPQEANALLIVVDGLTPEQATHAVDHLAAALRARPALFERVHLADGGDFFVRQGLLYRELSEIDDLAAAGTSARPLLDALARDPRADVLLLALAGAATTPARDLPLALAPVYDEAATAVRAAARGDAVSLSWQSVTTPSAPAMGTTERVVLAAPVFDFAALQPAGAAIEELERLARETESLAGPGLQVRITGEPMLEHEELRTLSEGTALAGIASFVLVCTTLLFAYRSPKLVLATFTTLAMGLVLSMAFATVAIGHLNLISIAFAVLFIGMGDAFSSHFCLRYRELLERGVTQREALRETARSTGPSLALCMVTAAIGLYAFIPTDYAGVSELGVIAGTSMAIAFATTFTVLPALLAVMPLRPASAWRQRPRETPALLGDWPLRHARTIRIATVVLALAALALLPRVQADFNPINLRDQGTESVRTLRHLLASRETSPLVATALAADEASARALAARFAALPSVDRITTAFDFVPEDQARKLDAVRRVRESLGAAPDRLQGPPMREALEQLEGALHVGQAARLRPEDEAAMRRLRDALRDFLAATDALPEGERAARYALLDRNLFGALPQTLDRLRQSLRATPVTVDTLPPELRERWIAADGTWRIDVHPKEDLNDLEHMRRFVREVQSVDPRATGLPVVYVESMRAVVRAFVQAFAVALAASALLLLIVLRSLRDTLLVLLPLLLASVLTAAATVLLGVPFNFANIIALPLLFGLGIDSGIHMAHRLRHLERKGGTRALFDSSEAKGVVYGTLTTIFSFLSLAFLSHAGTASLGQLLAIGLFFTLLCALVVLPAFSPLGWRSGRRDAPPVEASA